VRDRLFTLVLAGAFAHGFYLVYPFPCVLFLFVAISCFGLLPVHGIDGLCLLKHFFEVCREFLPMSLWMNVLASSIVSIHYSLLQIDPSTVCNCAASKKWWFFVDTRCLFLNRRLITGGY